MTIWALANIQNSRSESILETGYESVEWKINFDSWMSLLIYGFGEVNSIDFYDLTIIRFDIKFANFRPELRITFDFFPRISAFSANTEYRDPRREQLSQSITYFAIFWILKFFQKKKTIFRAFLVRGKVLQSIEKQNKTWMFRFQTKLQTLLILNIFHDHTTVLHKQNRHQLWIKNSNFYYRIGRPFRSDQTLETAWNGRRDDKL